MESQSVWLRHSQFCASEHYQLRWGCKLLRTRILESRPADTDKLQGEYFIYIAA